MTPTAQSQPSGIYKIQCEDGHRYVIYNASEIGNPPDHVANKWYVRSYPVTPGLEAGPCFNSALEAESAARAHRV